MAVRMGAAALQIGVDPSYKSSASTFETII